MSLFSPFSIRDITFRNRIAVSPMCQYSSKDGNADDWHLVHLGSRAVGGAALVIMEATAVTPEGRISPQDMGLWKDEQIQALSRITNFLAKNGSIAGIQLAHAGRKASTPRPWDATEQALSPSQGGWSPVYGPSALPFDEKSPTPKSMTKDEIHTVVQAFYAAAQRSVQAGFQVMEVHAAHGYLLHEFLSPLSNQRTDEYGGSLENRSRFLREVVESVRSVWPERYPLFVRISATDWVEDGWDLPESIELCKMLKSLGVDLIDCSTGGNVPDARIPVAPGYQVPFAEAIRKEAGLYTGAVGMITEPRQANAIIESGQADMILLGRELLRDPYWPLHAAQELGMDIAWAQQYERAKPRRPIPVS